MIRSVRDIPTLEGVPVLVRAALNVPIENDAVANDYRLRRAIPTIEFLAKRGARVVLISHIGEKGTETLAPVVDALKKLTRNVSFCPSTIDAEARSAIRNLLPGDVLVLENLRRNAGEKANDPAFAKALAALADVFVQDSFDTCHRAHASIVGVPQYLPSYAGLVVEEEFSVLLRARRPERPALAVVGGAKFSTKEPVLNALLAAYDHVFVGGALANDFLKASGMPIGDSLISTDDDAGVRSLLRNPRLVLPADVRVVAARAPNAPVQARTVSVNAVREDERILDIGPETSARLAALAREAKTVLWNGPVGNYENGFGEATDDFAKTVAHSGAYSVIGGGDTIASIEGLGLLARFSFVSTGGGAMLDLLVHGMLPGIQALDR